MTKLKIVPLLLVSALVLLAAIYLYSTFVREEKLVSELANEVPMAETSIEGKVLEVRGKVVKILTGRMEKDESGGKYLEYEREVELTASSTRLRVGDRAVFYSKRSSSFTNDTFLSHRVEFIRADTSL